MRLHDDHRKSQLGICYAISARSELCGASFHMSKMQQSSTLFEWRSSYKAAIVMCRSALHVLHKKDSDRCRFMAAALEPRYAAWKAGGTVGSTFLLLEQERNSLLKEGKSTFQRETMDRYEGEPRLLFGDRFIVGSELIREILAWELYEIEVIEDVAHGARRVARQNSVNKRVST